MYVDPVTDASIDFQQRLAQMASLEAETKRTERQMIVLARAKRKLQPPAAASVSAAAAAGVPAAAAGVVGTKSKDAS